MTYRAKTNPDMPSIVFLYLLINLTVSLKPFSWPLLIVIIGFGFIFLIIALLRYNVTIEDTKIQVVTSLFSFQLTDRTYYARNMEKLKFKRVGFHSPAAFIHLNYGITVRLPHYSPPEAYEALEQFAIANNIQVYKTKDYKVVEKMIKHKKAAQ